MPVFVVKDCVKIYGQSLWDTMTITLGEYVTRLKDQKNWSTRDLAKRAGVSHEAIRKIEVGSTENPGLKAIVGLAEALGVHEMDLIYAFKGIDPETLSPEQKRNRNRDLGEALKDVLKEQGLLE